MCVVTRAGRSDSYPTCSLLMHACRYEHERMLRRQVSAHTLGLAAAPVHMHAHVHAPAALAMDTIRAAAADGAPDGAAVESGATGSAEPQDVHSRAAGTKGADAADRVLLLEAASAVPG